ncbi:MAG: DUF6316 family protein [Gammaproteobacteria bacterium]|nr:DUF6316 family protein [Gammaproteobacteria bacterium]
MSDHRAGEEDKNIPFRSERYFCTNGMWYFETREGKQVGPFTSKDEMQGELLLYMREMNMVTGRITKD